MATEDELYERLWQLEKDKLDLTEENKMLKELLSKIRKDDDLTLSEKIFMERIER